MKNLLPIGSVVRLKEGMKYLMLIGILQEDEEGNSYDYIACVFPEGYIDEETFFLFNHEDIEEVEFLGCVNAQTQSFFETLRQQGLLEDMHNDVTNESDNATSENNIFKP
ncbi:MAG: DUF4176 domain-containing protein [Roseburia sp.]|nr:DUF4176 domain-containing protein [Roseburia sp.]